jgi:hypothetical protein
MSKRGLVHRLRPWVVAVWLASLAAPTVLLLAQGLEASLADVKGQVQVSRAGSSQYETADANTRLATGDRVRTLANSSARLAFFEGSTTDLAGLTAVRIDDQSQSDTQSSIRLLQAGGVSEAQVQQQTPDKPTIFQVESPASTVSASPATCPWTRVGPDGTTLVRNYWGGASSAVAPQDVKQVIYVPMFVPGVGGLPMPVQIPQLVTVYREMPPSTAPDEQPLFRCPYGVPTAERSSVVGAGLTITASSSMRSGAPDLVLGGVLLTASTRPLLGAPLALDGQPGAADDLPAVDVPLSILEQQSGSEQVTLETRQPDVQWSPAGT